MNLYYLKIALVAILCVPILYVGIRFIGSLLDSALAGKKKGK
jgi:hypothetical protein